MISVEGLNELLTVVKSIVLILALKLVGIVQPPDTEILVNAPKSSLSGESIDEKFSQQYFKLYLKRIWLLLIIKKVKILFVLVMV